MSFYDRQFGQLDDERADGPEPEPKPESRSFAHFIRKNLSRMALWNLLTALTGVPAAVLLELYWLTGAFVFLPAAALCALPVGPAWVCVNHLNFLIVRRVPRYRHPAFWEFYRANFRQGAEAAAVAATLALIFGIWLQGMSGLGAFAPPAVWCAFFAAAVLAVAFVLFCFAQIALFSLPFSAVLKNSLLLLFSGGWRGLCASLIQTAFLVGVVLLSSRAVPLLVILGPAFVDCLACRLIWPKLRALVFRGEDSAGNEP